MSAAVITTAPPALWRIARAFICVLHDLFGGPEDIARAHSLTHAAYTLLLSWVQVGEAMMRRLIAIEAAAFPKPNTRPLLHTKRPRKRRVLGFDHDKPEEWRVSFRCVLGAPAPRQRSEDGPAALSRMQARIAGAAPAVQGAPRFHSAWPLAERYEALIRVFNDPAPYARRLAARLHARPHLIAAVLAAPPEYEHRVEQAPVLTHAAERAWPQRCDSS